MTGPEASPRAPRRRSLSLPLACVALLLLGSWLAVGLVAHPQLEGCPPPARGIVGPGPIQHIFVVVKENHAFENYFGTLPGVLGGPPTGSFPVAYGATTTISPFPIAGSSTPDLPHDRDSAVAEVNGGRMDQFVAQAAAAGYPDPTAAVGYYTEAQIPQYFTLARSYALDDEFFSGVLGPTLPNRLFDLAATSGGWTSDEIPGPDVLDFPTILDQLSGNGVAWAYDYAGAETNLTPVLFPSIAGDPCRLAAVAPLADLPDQLDGASPPSVTFVDPAHDFTYSEHPAQNVTLGADWTATLLNTIFDSPVGPSSAVFFFYDENGGFWDPTPPPSVDALGDGVRVPFLVISPYTSAGIVHRVLDPASVLRYVDDRLGLGPLNARVAAAPDLGSFFDPALAPRPWVDLPTPLSFAAISDHRSTPLTTTHGGTGPASTAPAAPVAAVVSGAGAVADRISRRLPWGTPWRTAGSPSTTRSRSCSSRREGSLRSR